MNIDSVCNKISKQVNLTKEQVKNIVLYEFQFTADIMKNDTDTKDILFNELFKFKLKPRFKNNKQIKNSPNENNNISKRR